MRQPTGDNTLAGYVRQSSADITPTATLRAAPINAEYNKLRDAFAVSSGHKHDGSTGEGGYIPLIGDVDALNKVVIDTSNNRVGVFIEVSSAAVEQLRFQDGAIVPVTTNDIDLGTSSLEFKDLYLDGTAHIDTLDVDINGAVAGTFTIGSTLGVTGTTTLSTANITTGVITSVDINSGAIDNVTIGGTTAGAGTFTTINASGTSTLATVDIGAGAIDGTTIGANSASPATVTNLTATGTSTLSTVDINAGAIDGTTIGASSAAAGSFTTVNTSGQATLATVDINGGNIDGAIIGASATAAITGTTITGSSLVGPLTGNVSGNTAGVHTGNVTGNVTGNITASSGASTLNNLTVNGTLDVTGTTIANVTDPTNAQDAATKNYVDTEVSALVDSSPSALNTLNELAAAINDDASFSTTITNSIATKLPLAGGTMSGAIAMGTSKITGLGNPTANQDASTKAYVDSAALLKVGGTMSGALAMGNNKITGLGTPTATTDATTKTYVDGILGSATAAATSATNAATSETNAATSATNASNSASAASTSATNAASSYDQFDDRYLGAKSSAPTVDNDGDALITGALYFNSTTNIMNVYGSGGWQSAGSAVNGTSERNTYTATAGQTVFAATYDSGYVDVFLNGVKLLAGTDFTATNGTSITLASGASVNDVVDIVAYGTFVLADHYTKIAADARYVNVAGDTMTGDLTLGDNDKAIFGAGSDLQIYSDGTHSYLKETGSGNLWIGGANIGLGNPTASEYFVECENNGAVKLYYDNAVTLATTATGVDVTGNLALGNNDKVVLGDTSNLQIFSTGTSAYIAESGSGDLYIKGSSIYLNDSDNNQYIHMSDTGTGGTVILKHNAVSKLSTTSTGIDVTGTATMDGLTVDAGANSELRIDTDAAGYLQVGQFTNGAFIGTSSTNTTYGKLRLGAGTKRFVDVDTSGDISFYEDTGITAKMVWKASEERLGIGTDDPSGKTHSVAANNQVAVMAGGDVSDPLYPAFGFDGQIGSNGGRGAGMYLPTDGNLAFSTAGTEAFRIDSSQNLLVGTTSTPATLTGTSTESGIGFDSTAGYGVFVRNGSTPLYANRLTSDGAIVDFRKDGTTVGNIGVESNAVYFAGVTYGIKPYSAGIAASNSSGAFADGAADLGKSNIRFKDLYLSGGIYLGGAVAANKLDDYEEGTWTPVIEDTTGNAASASVNGFYVKVGRVVYATIEANSINTAGLNSGERLYVDGWPFATSNLTGSPNRTAAVYTNHISFNGGSDMIAAFPNNNTRCAFLNNRDATSHSGVYVNDIVSTSASIEFSIVYDAT